MTRAISWEEERYYVITDQHQLFLFADGDFTLTDTPRTAYGFVRLDEAIRALDYCRRRYSSGHIIRARLVLAYNSSIGEEEIKKEIRKNALSKLTDEEKKTLGLLE